MSATVNNFYFVATITIVLLVFVHWMKRAIASRYGNQDFRSYLLKYAHELLAVSCLALMLYGIGWGLISVLWKNIPIHYIIQTERSLTKVAATLNDWKLTKLAVLSALMVVGFIAVWIGQEKGVAAIRWIKWLSTAGRRAYIFALVLAMFTLLGTFPGDADRDITARLRLLSTDYGTLRQIIADQVSDQSVDMARTQILGALPPSLKHGLDLPKALSGEASSLRHLYEDANRSDNIISLVSDQVLYRVDTRNSRIVTASEASQGLLAQTRRAFALQGAPLPEEATPGQISEAIDALTPKREIVGRSFALSSIQSKTGREVVLQVPRVVTDSIKRGLFSPWIDAYPALGPVIDIVASASGDAVGQEVSKRVDRIARQVLQDPKQADQVIQSNASEIAYDIDQSLPLSSSIDIEGANAAVMKDIGDVRTARRDVESKLAAADTARFDLAIQDLSDSRKATREAAVRTLRAAVGKLNQAQIQRLEVLAAGTGPPWREYLRRGPHCTYYEETSYGYPASRVLLDVPDAKVSPPARSSAQRQVASGSREVRIDDPGWI